MRLTNPKIETLDLSALSSCQSLKKLSLQLESLTSVSRSPLAGLPALEAINIYAVKLTSLDLSPLVSLPAQAKRFVNSVRHSGFVEIV